MKRLLTTLLLVCAVMTAADVAAQPLLRTHVETGDVEGIADGTLAVYKAIPYAAPPVGDLRWREPQPAKAWEGVRLCDKFGPLPPQPTRQGRTADMMSEDCLYLGIATPARSTADRLPVMVWIHGGGFQTEWYGGDLWKHLAQRGVVIVSVEYRTGALGFMAHPELTKESKNGHSGNYGLLDQIFALQWVQRNISSFGGDPTCVTIFGESAGAISCSMLCASPLAKGLFHRCISQSGGSFAPWSDQPRSLGLDASQKGAELQGINYQKHLKKKNLKQMRKMDAMALCGNDVGFGGFWPCVDGYVICDDQYRLYERGEYNDVPVIVMTNSDEGALFSPGNIKAENYQKQVRQIFGSWADEALKVYPGNTDDEAWHGNGAVGPLLLRDVHALEDDGPGGGDLQQVQRAEEGGFAGAGGPDDHHHVPLVDIHAHPVQGLDVLPVVILFQVPDLDQIIVCRHGAASFQTYPAASRAHRSPRSTPPPP